MWYKSEEWNMKIKWWKLHVFAYIVLDGIGGRFTGNRVYLTYPFWAIAHEYHKYFELIWIIIIVNIIICHGLIALINSFKYLFFISVSENKTKIAKFFCE